MNSENNNPWGKGPSGKGNFADDLFDKVESLFSKKGNGSSGGKGGGPSDGKGGKALLLIPLIVIGGWMASGFYQVKEGEAGVVLRFGKMVNITTPGLRYHLPNPIESVLLVRVDAENRIDSGTEHAKRINTYKEIYAQSFKMQRTMGAKSSNVSYVIDDQNLTLTGDENLVHINYAVLWRIKDVKNYLFSARNPDDTIKAAAESCIRQVVGQIGMRVAITTGRAMIAESSQKLLQTLMDQYEIGVQIINLQLLPVVPPEQVSEAYADLQSSENDAISTASQAEAYRNDLVPRTRGIAAGIRQQAEGYNKQVIAKAEGETKHLSLVLEEFAKNPATLSREYFKVMGQVLQGDKSKIIIDPKSGAFQHFSLDKITSKMGMNPKMESKDAQ